MRYKECKSRRSTEYEAFKDVLKAAALKSRPFISTCQSRKSAYYDLMALSGIPLHSQLISDLGVNAGII